MRIAKRYPGESRSSNGAVRELAYPLRDERKWPIRYDYVEPLAILGDFATIIFASVVSGLSYHLHGTGSAGDISQSIGAATLVSALFISLMKIRGMYRPTELLVLRRRKGS